MNNIKDYGLKLKKILINFFSNKKNVIIFVGVLIFIILFIIFSNKGFEMVSSGISDSRRFKNEYESLNNKIVYGNKKYPKVNLPDNDIIKYLKIEDILDIFDNKKDGVVYFGYPTCLYCRNAIQILLDTAVNTELDELLYVDIEDYWDIKKLDLNGNVINEKEADSKYFELLNVLGNELTTDYILKDDSGKEVNTGVKRIRYPLVIFITDGNVASYHIGTIFFQDDPFVPMDESQINGLSRIYRSGIEDVVTSKKYKGLLK